MDVSKGAALAGFMFEACVHVYFEYKASKGKAIIDGCVGNNSKYPTLLSKCAKFDDELIDGKEGVYHETVSQNFPRH